VTRRNRRRRQHEEHENEERWLLTYADMITLLMALFMVLFSISSTNVSKLKDLQKSLQDAFSGKVLPGGQSLLETGANDMTKVALEQPPTVSPPNTAAAGAVAAREQRAGEQASFERLKREVDAEVRREHLQGKVSTRITVRGLGIRILSDGLLFDSGQADVKPAGAGLLSKLAPLLRRESGHQVVVQGHTDNVPITGSQYPSNWELSTARASAVVRVLLRKRLPPERMEASGRAQLDPVSPNATDGGRAKNRRVEIVLPRSTAIPGSSP
jgi:chemotaxis protein MotB